MNHEYENMENHDRTGNEIAVIGVSGRFPGAKTVETFWENLKNGVESLTFFSDEELEESGVNAELIKNPAYVSARGILEDIDYFDSSFFDYTPADAGIMDPQMRILHECVWEALEDAGYTSVTYGGFIGLYAGASSSFNWKALTMLADNGVELDWFSSMQLNDKDFMTTRVSYKLDLKGPSFTMYTACSTSLVAVVLACQGLLSGDCDMALAGGVTAALPQDRGYVYRDGMIASPDGHCRAFDEKAGGIASGNGAGIVLLKLLEEAVEDGDNIYAVIKGGAVNNDGCRKAGFTAPSIDGQAEAVRAALEMAEFDPETIRYIETHGTGTALGDPVEIEALRMVFDTPNKGFCPIGSIKTNMGHLDSAAGIAGFIKTVLVLKHRLIPPSLHFQKGNPRIDFDNSPFYVNTRLRAPGNTPFPFRAGVSSFGIGGTNAHVVMEEWIGDPEPKTGDRGREQQLILLSAKTETALEKKTGDLAAHLEKNPNINLADVAYTLQVGRQPFAHRRMLTASTVDGALRVLSSPDSGDLQCSVSDDGTGKETPVVFMFSGQGSQYVDMGLELYRAEPLFRREMDRCFSLLKYDLEEIVFNRSNETYKTNRTYTDELNRTEFTQPALFIFEYALARLLMSWGVKPHAMIGHSIGEYVAAHLAGVFSLEDALAIVTLRGKSMQQMPPGDMLSVSLPEEQLTPLLNGKLSLAAVNSSALCTVSGPHEDVRAFEKELVEKGHRCRRLHTSHAFHSDMMTPMLAGFEARLMGINFKTPQIPYISNLTGNWITADQAVDPAYWAAHVRRAVRFSDGLDVLLEKENTVFLEIGPGKSLCTFVRDHAGKKRGHRALNLVRHPSEEVSDTRHLLEQIGRLWLSGVTPDWTGFHGGEKRKRISLPVYPFERRFYPVNGDPYLMAAKMMNEGAGAAPLTTKKTDMADWFYVPLWEQTMMPRPSRPAGPGTGEDPGSVNRLIFIPEKGPGPRLAEASAKNGGPGNVVIAAAGSRFDYSRDSGFTIRPSHGDDYDALFHKLRELNLFPHKIVHLWGVTGNAEKPSIETIDRELDLEFYSLLHIVQAVGRMGILEKIELNIVTDNMQKVTGDELLCPRKAAVLGAVKVIPLEHPNIYCRSIDIVLPEPGGPREKRLFAQLEAEFRTDSPRGTEIAAYRAAHRWVPVIKPHRLDDPGDPGNGTAPLKQGGVYLVTGGLGGMGLTLAQYLAKSVNARLILVGRSALPPREEWDRWLEDHDHDDPVGRKIAKIREMERSGAEVMVAAADVADPGQMSAVVSQARERFGPVNGVLHTAGVADYEGMILRRTREMTERVMASKVRGTLVLDHLFKDTPLDFFVLFSSIGNVAYKIKFGQVGYNAANEFLEAFARYDRVVNGKPTSSINWNDWLEVGMSIEAVNRQVTDQKENIDYETLLHDALTPPQGVEAFRRILGSGPVNVTVSLFDLVKTVGWLDAEWDRQFSGSSPDDNEDVMQAPPQNRPDVNTPYAAPREKTDRQLAQVWQDFFGYDRIGINDDFFDIGGDSLKATVLLARIHKQLDVKIPINEIFTRPTIRKLAEYIDRAEKTAHSSIEPAEKREYYAQSSAQKRLYILNRMNPDSAVYNESSFFPVNAEYRKEDLKKITRLLLKRHESLRTSFIMVTDEPVQKVHPFDEVELPIDYFDVSDAPDDAGENEALRAAAKRFVRPFDLSAAPLARLGFVKRRSDNMLMIDMHHIVTDEVSKRVFIEDIMTYIGGVEPPPLPLQYRDFSQWQNSPHRQKEIAKMEAYWMKCFEGDLPQLKLPLDFNRGDRIGKMGYVSSELPGAAAAKLITLSKERDVTIFMVFLALYNVFLSRITGAEDIVVGTVAAGRGHSDLDRIIGMFVNTLAIRGNPGAELTFNQFLEDVKTRTLGAFENQDYPFEDLVDRLVKTREPGRNPLFDVVFSYYKNDEADPEKMSSPGEVEAGVLNRPAKFDIIFTVSENKNSISISFNYNVDLFKEETVKRFFHYMGHICTVVSENPEIALIDIVISHELTAATASVIESEEGDFGF